MLPGARQTHRIDAEARVPASGAAVLSHFSRPHVGGCAFPGMKAVIAQQTAVGAHADEQKRHVPQAQVRMMDLFRVMARRTLDTLIRHRRHSLRAPVGARKNGPVQVAWGKRSANVPFVPWVFRRSKREKGPTDAFTISQGPRPRNGSRGVSSTLHIPS